MNTIHRSSVWFLLLAAVAGCDVDAPEVGSDQQALKPIDNDGPGDDGPLDPDWEPDPPPPPPPDDRTCTGPTKTFLVDAQVGTDGLLALSGTHIQISHTQKGQPIVGETRTFEVPANIPAHKFDILEAAAEKRCSTKPDPDACMDAWYASMVNRVTVHTVTPKYYSYVQWGPLLQLHGLTYETLPVPVIEKSVSSTFSKVVLSILVPVTIGFNVDRMRCHINGIESNIALRDGFALFPHNGRMRLEMQMESFHNPTLKCEGHAIGLYGLFDYGWSDEWFPDVNISNAELAVELGEFDNVGGVPVFRGASVTWSGDLDINNIPGWGEDIIDFFKDYRNRVRDRIQEKLAAALNTDFVKQKVGAALIAFAKQKTGDDVTAVCDVDRVGHNIQLEYQVPCKGPQCFAGGIGHTGTMATLNP